MGVLYYHFISHLVCNSFVDYFYCVQTVSDCLFTETLRFSLAVDMFSSSFTAVP